MWLCYHTEIVEIQIMFPQFKNLISRNCLGSKSNQLAHGWALVPLSCVCSIHKRIKRMQCILFRNCLLTTQNRLFCSLVRVQEVTLKFSLFVCFR